MALSLTEASRLSNDTLLAGVIESILPESPLMAMATFEQIVGNGLTYNRENAAPSASFFDVGDTWNESTPTFTQATATLKILGGDADVDNFLALTRSNIQDLQAEVIRLKANALTRLFEDTFVNGDSILDPNSFDGIDILCDAGQTVSMGTDGAPLTLDKVDELIDTVRPGKPDVLLMNRRARRSFNKLARNSGTFLETDRNEFGTMIQFYDGIPIALDDNIATDQTVGTTSINETIYAWRWGLDGLQPLFGGASPIQVETLGSLETKDATRHRVKAYLGLALFRTTSLARLVGVQEA